MTGVTDVVVVVVVVVSAVVAAPIRDCGTGIRGLRSHR